jgi:hypothetical protein
MEVKKMSKNTLLIGKPGSGKTTAIATAPNKPIALFDVDNKAHSMNNIAPFIESGDIVIIPFKEKLVEGSLVERALHPDEKIKTQPVGYLKILEILNSFIDEGTDQYEENKKYGTLAVDSLSRIVEHMKRLLIYLRGQGKFGKKVEGDMNWPSWGSYLTNLEELFTNLCLFDRDLIVTAHEKLETEKVKMGEEITYVVLDHWPHVDGQMMKRLAGYFNEVYFMDVELKAKQPPSYRFRTRGRKYCASSSFKVDEFEPANIAKLYEKK